MTFDEWMLIRDVTYYPTDDTVAIRKLRECWYHRDAEVESLRQQLDAAQAELEAERNRRFEGNRISSKEYNDSQKLVALMRDVVLETKKYLDQTYADLIGNLGAEWLAARIVDHLSPTLSKALAATADLDGLILCDAEPVAWMFEGLTGTYFGKEDKLPRPEAIQLFRRKQP